jgi:hypothetical protein
MTRLDLYETMARNAGQGVGRIYRFGAVKVSLAIGAGTQFTARR